MASRKHFLTTQDVRNIKRKVQENIIIKHEDDATSVSLAVEELRQEPFNPVLAFKPQGVELPEFPLLPKQTFLLVIQTKFQMQLFQQHASKVICIDSTHGTNAYRFRLITCIVPDDFGHGKSLLKCLLNGHNFLHLITRPASRLVHI